MAHTYVNALFHCVFSTKGRRQLITADLQERLWPFMGGIARENGAKALAVGGVEDHFAWQEGYGAFSIGVSQVPSTVAYIRSQPEHHRRLTFEEEFRAFLKKHAIEYDERYVWG